MVVKKRRKRSPQVRGKARQLLEEEKEEQEQEEREEKAKKRKAKSSEIPEDRVHWMIHAARKEDKKKVCSLARIRGYTNADAIHDIVEFYLEHHDVGQEARNLF